MLCWEAGSLWNKDYIITTSITGSDTTTGHVIRNIPRQDVPKQWLPLEKMHPTDEVKSLTVSRSGCACQSEWCEWLLQTQVAAQMTNEKPCIFIIVSWRVIYVPVALGVPGSHQVPLHLVPPWPQQDLHVQVGPLCRASLVSLEDPAHPRLQPNSMLNKPSATQESGQSHQTKKLTEQSNN